MRGDGSDPGRARGRRPGASGTNAAIRVCHDRGQSTVELALALPVVLVLALALVQIGLVVRDQILVVHAAREGARAAAVAPDAGSPRRAAELHSGLRGDRLEVTSAGRAGPGSHVRVTVVYRSATDLPLVGPLLPDLTLTAEATMRVEQ